MTNLKTLTAIAVLSAAIATPALAQDSGVLGPGSRNGLTPQPGVTYHHARAYHHRSSFRGAYNQWNGRYDRGRDSSWCSWSDCRPPWLRSAHGG